MSANQPSDRAGRGTRHVGDAIVVYDDCVSSEVTDEAAESDEDFAACGGVILRGGFGISDKGCLDETVGEYQVFKTFANKATDG